jgi:hypothetical protein
MPARPVSRGRQGIKPRDCVEAMLVAQMVSVHVTAMRFSEQLAGSQDPVRQDSAARALDRLARTFPDQIEALSRYRGRGEPAITVQNMSVADGGNAIVGNVTQHANVIVSDSSPAGLLAQMKAGFLELARHNKSGAVRRRLRVQMHDTRCGARIRSGGACRAHAVHGKKRCRMHGGAPGSGA